jgi:nucleoid DNA-binding protein
MDIAKYIGLFLLKNQFCYVHGLGNLELRKLPATHDSKALNAPVYDVIVSPAGSIDDNLANFIATNEQISISKAANALREFSIQARKDMAEGREVPIPNIGKFVEENGRIKFITDPHFKYTPASIPVIKNSKQLEEQQAHSPFKPAYPDTGRGTSVNWSMIILVVVLLAILAGGGYGIYHYLQQNKTADSTATTDATTTPAPVVTPTVSTAPDSSVVNQPDTTAANAAIDSNQVYSIKWVIGSYRSKARADRRVETLGLSHIPAEVTQRDSTSYFVLTTVNSRTVDTAHVRDSLVRFYGYKEVTIYQ